MNKENVQNDKNTEEQKNTLNKEKLYVKVTAKKLHRRKMLTRVLILIIIAILLFLSTLYAIIYIVNETGNFTISLDPNLRSRQKIEISPYSNFSEKSLILKANSLEYMDNISESWIPEDIDNEEGDHSKDNYIAYTFFVRNYGEETSAYETRIIVLSVIKNVDEAVRVAVYKNGEKEVYAKKSKTTGDPEPNTIPFVSNQQVMFKKNYDFKPGDVDKYTIVIWLEGDDQECIDDILGGEMKLKMHIKEVDS